AGPGQVTRRRTAVELRRRATDDAWPVLRFGSLRLFPHRWWDVPLDFAIRHPSLVTRSLLRFWRAHTEPRSLFSRGAAESAEGVAGPGRVLRGAERSSPGSTFKLNVVSAGGIHAHPAGEPAGRGRLHPANGDSPGATTTSRDPGTRREVSAAPKNHSEPRPLRALRTSAFSAPPRELMTPRLCVSVSPEPGSVLRVSERGAGGATPGRRRRGRSGGPGSRRRGSGSRTRGRPCRGRRTGCASRRGSVRAG